MCFGDFLKPSWMEQHTCYILLQNGESFKGPQEKSEVVHNKNKSVHSDEMCSLCSLFSSGVEVWCIMNCFVDITQWMKNSVTILQYL
jgi:hypothetical protein